MTPIQSAQLGAITAACLAAAAQGQVTYLSDLRHLSVTARAGSTTDAFNATPSAPFAPFDVPTTTTAATFGDAATTASAAHHSALAPAAIEATGSARAAGTSQGLDPGSAQAASSFFVTFRLASPQRLSLRATLSQGSVSSAQLVLQSSGGGISYFLDGSAPQPIAIDRTLPAGDYTLVAYASAAIALYPFADLADGCDYTLTTTFSCPADFNADGFLDFFDYDDFVNCFESANCPPAATDFNADGFTDFFDYDDFVTAYESGC